MERLTIGQMARLNNTSERALRIYHNMGLLIPQYIDGQTSYRYYSPLQSKKLNMILHMKSVGLPLKQIKYIMDNKDLAMFEAVLLDQIESINNQVVELQLKENVLRSMLETCKNFLNPPSLRNIYVEYQANRRAYYFDIEPFDYVRNYKCNEHSWEKELEQVKASILKSGMPVIYFNGVGCIIRQQDLDNGKFICRGAFILPHDKLKYRDINLYDIKSGTYVCMFDRWHSGDSMTEANGITQLLSYIREKDFEICGDYIAEVTAESSIFDSETHMSIVKMQIPVRITNQNTAKGSQSQHQ